jgi:hypothetical protein
MDAASVDAASMAGVWRLDRLSIAGPGADGGLALTTTDQRVIDPTTGKQVKARASGLLDLTSDQGELALSRVIVFDNHMSGSHPADRALVSTITKNDPDTFLLGTGDSLKVAWDPTLDLLTLTEQGGTQTTYARYMHTAVHRTLELRGEVSIEDGQAALVPLAHPRATLAFVVREGDGIAFREVPDGSVALPSTFGKTSTDLTPFDLSRQDGPVGLERIPFGDTASLALGLVVVYDDVDQDSVLGALYDSCASPDKDCVRGVSRVVVAYRFGTSPQLSASPFAFLRTGWTWALWADDTRTAEKRRGLVSCDPSAVALPSDVRIPRDPKDVRLPPFVL